MWLFTVFANHSKSLILQQKWRHFRWFANTVDSIERVSRSYNKKKHKRQLHTNDIQCYYLLFFSFSAAILILATKAFFEISAMHFICSGMNHLSMCSFQRCQKLIGPAVLCLYKNPSLIKGARAKPQKTIKSHSKDRKMPVFTGQKQVSFFKTITIETQSQCLKKHQKCLISEFSSQKRFLARNSNLIWK